MATTPKTVADAIAAGVTAAGGKVTYSNADERGRCGRMYLQMADGTAVSIQIEIQD